MVAEHPFLAGMSPRLIGVLAGCASNVRFGAGEFLLREGRSAERFYLIRRGRTAIELFIPERGPVTLQTVGEGDLLGWSWLIEPYRWRFDARALEPVSAIAFDGKCLRRKCEQDHELGYELLRRLAGELAQRLEAARLHIQDLYAYRA